MENNEKKSDKKSEAANKSINRQKKYRPTMLVIMDGCGYSENEYGNAVMQADTPTLDTLFSDHPHTLIKSSGLSVGLPEGQMGNSEVGHLNIGAGRVVYQSLSLISKSIKDGDFYENAVLRSAMTSAKEKKKALHLMGLVGPGGVHSHQDHLVALIKMAKLNGLEKIYIHAWLDGRDTPPRSALGFLSELEKSIKQIGAGRIVTISGRYYAMDRDNRWERIELAYDAITTGADLRYESANLAIEAAYGRGEDDEFVKPTNICPPQESPVLINSGDSVIFFNFRPDRARELTRALTEPEFGKSEIKKNESDAYDDRLEGVSEETVNTGFIRKAIPEELYFVTMTEYDASLKYVHIAYPPKKIDNTLGEYISKNGLKQLRIAETEKYAHVTFFFNGGEEEPNPGEDRVLIPSPKVATYDLKPEMSAYEVGDAVIEKIKSNEYDLIILNFANMDMVGHTGVMDAAIKAVHAVDENLGRIVKQISEQGGELLITADHGNSEEMLTEDGKPVTAHSTDPVPLFFVRDDDAEWNLKSGGSLEDIAPTILSLMGLDIPKEMTGTDLLERKG